MRLDGEKSGMLQAWTHADLQSPKVGMVMEDMALCHGMGGQMNPVKELRKMTGMDMKACRQAFITCGQDINLAYEYLKLKSQAVIRYKNVDGRKVPYTDSDYLALAKNKIGE